MNASDSSSSLVTIHQLSKGRSQIPVAKLKGLVQRVLFSPAAQPLLFVATQTEVKVYNLVKQTLVNKLKTGVKWVSSMDVHPSGDNVVVGSISTFLPRPLKHYDITRKPFAGSNSIPPIPS